MIEKMSVSGNRTRGRWISRPALNHLAAGTECITKIISYLFGNKTGFPFSRMAPDIMTSLVKFCFYIGFPSESFPKI